VQLGLSKAQFFALTPRLFATLAEAWRRDREGKAREQRALLAILRADIINFSQRAPKRWIGARDLLPAEDLRGQGESSRPQKLTAKRRRQIAEQIRVGMVGLCLR